MSNVPPPPPQQGDPTNEHSPVPPPPPPDLQPPPGYVAYGSAPTPTGRVARIGGLAKAITVLVAVAGAITLIIAILSPGATNSAEEFLDGESTSSEFTDAIVAFTLVQGAAGVVTFAAMIIVMIWMYRLASNLRTFGISTTWHPLWAVFGWFLPPVLYIIPLLMLRELWSKSTNSADADTSADGENPMLWIWFALFSVVPVILAVVQAGSFADQFSSQGAETQANTLVDAGALNIVSPLVTVAAAAVWIFFVRQLSDRHIELTGER